MAFKTTDPCWLVRSAQDPDHPIDVTRALIAAVASRLHDAFGGNDTVNWIEAERHVRRWHDGPDHPRTSFTRAIQRLSELRRADADGPLARRASDVAKLDDFASHTVTCLEQELPDWLSRAPRAGFSSDRICGRVGLVAVPDRPARRPIPRSTRYPEARPPRVSHLPHHSL